ncbi:hypothetical protein [Chitinophaga sp.]|uniref:DUF7151 family protein n=1 Tax=Chitinophaga sp. TaxID=1869181 RepID=UPI0031D7E22A
MKITLYLALTLAAFGISCKKQYYQYNKSLIDIQSVKANESCPNGGYVILSGNDVNFNGTLDSNEVQNREYICNGSDASSDKKTILSFGIPLGTATSSAAGTILGAIPQFNKLDYSNVDSITVYASLNKGYATDPVAINATVEVYNVTDNTVIAGSAVGSLLTATPALVESRSFYSSLPEKNVNLAIRYKSPVDGYSAVINYAYLIVYKH